MTISDKLANSIAVSATKLGMADDEELLRDYIDTVTGQELDTIQMDIALDMVRSRLAR